MRQEKVQRERWGGGRGAIRADRVPRDPAGWSRDLTEPGSSALLDHFTAGLFVIMMAGVRKASRRDPC